MLRIFKYLLILLVVLPMVLGAWIATEFYFSPQRTLKIDTAVIHEIPVGASVRTIVKDLHAQGIIDRPWYLEWQARLHHQQNRIKAGDYVLEPGLTYAQLLELWVSGQVLSYRLTIPEGFTFLQMMQAIAAHEQIEKTLTADQYMDVMRWLGKPDMHPEGWFFPDTYLFSRNTTDMELLTHAHQRMEEILAATWHMRDDDLPIHTPYEALILASLVEKETAAPEERTMIAGVFTARLRQGMRLQTDPSVIYGLESFTGRLRRQDLRSDTPYNTYTREGLPPTPIALPGRAALEASVNPTHTDALFFVSRGDGTHHFSPTYQEHRAAVIRYQLGGDASRYGGGR